MKKVLLGTSALALAGAFASPAASAEWEVKVGGYMEQYIAYADSDVSGSVLSLNAGDFDGIDSKQDAEIFFIPSITLDNGIQFGANLQLEGFSTGDQIDEAYMFIKGSFGEINLGSENSAGYKMTYAAPDVTFVNVNSGSLTAFMPISGANTGADIFRGTLGTTFLENGRNNDAQRFTYYTPRFAGLQVGVSYARDGLQDSNGQGDTNSPSISAGNALAGIHDIFDIGVNYVNSFGDFNVAVSGRYGFADNNLVGGGSTTPEIWSAGINLGFAGFTIGGSYAEQDDALTQDGEAFDVGASYETGPWGFSVTYFHGSNVNNECGPVACGVGGHNEELDQYLVGLSYSLAKGVTLSAFGAYVEFEENGDAATIGEEVDGFVIGTGVKISF